MLFAAVNQINLGGAAAVTDAEEFFTFANHNLAAGKRAMEMAEFSSANSLFSHGIDFLRCIESHWQHHYQFSLELFELGAQTALATGNVLQVQNLTGEVLGRGRRLEDKLNVYSIIISSFFHASNVGEALQSGLAILAQLNEAVTSDLSQENLDQQTQQITDMLTRYVVDDIWQNRLSSDSNKLAVMQLLSQLQLIAFFAAPTLHPFLTIKMTTLTLESGVLASVPWYYVFFCKSKSLMYICRSFRTGSCASSPVAFAYLSSFLAKRSNFELSRKCSTLALSMVDRLSAPEEIVSQVLMVSAETQCFLQPLLSANELRVRGEAAAIKAGDIQFLCMNR